MPSVDQTQGFVALCTGPVFELGPSGIMCRGSAVWLQFPEDGANCTEKCRINNTNYIC